MPIYDFTCVGRKEHRFEARAGYEEDEVSCPKCEMPAFREAVYREQSVTFRGTGFTKSVVPPPAPEPPSTAHIPDPEDAKGVLDDFAKKHYEHDRNVRPYMREKLKKEKKDA